MRRTTISAGLVIYEALTECPELQEKGTDIFPGVSKDEVNTPFVCYRRTGTQTESVKGYRGPERTTIEVLCAADSYGEAVEIAEIVRDTIERKIITATETATGLSIICGGLVDSDDFVESETNFVSLIFNLEINGRSNNPD